MMTNLLFSQLTAIGKRFAMVLTMLLIVGVGQAWGAAVTFSSFSALGSSGYPSGSTTSDPITMSSTGWYGYSNTQLRIKSGATLTISCTEKYKITKVVFTVTGTNYAKLDSPVTWNSTTGTYSNVSGTNSITFSNSAQVRITKIVVTYESTASCDKKVTITKGDQTNGTFTLDKENGSYDNCDEDFVVTVSNIVPASSAKYCNGINVTGGNSSVTGPVDGVWTVTYTTGHNITSTITPTYAAKTPANISFENMGNPTPTTTGYYVGDTYTLPATNDYTCGDKTFVGWSTEIIENSATKPTAATYFEPGAPVTLKAEQTFYAVFAEEGGNDEETVLVNFTGGTKSDLTNSTGISASGLGSDYAESNKPYRVKLDDTGDYILYTNESNQYISQIYLKVKMIGGANTSTITLKTSDDNINFTTITNHDISGEQNNVRELSIEANTSAKYIQLYYTKGSNVGLGLLVIYAKSSSFQNYTTQCTKEPTRYSKRLRCPRFRAKQ